MGLTRESPKHINEVCFYVLARIWWSGKNVNRPTNLPGENSEASLTKEAAMKLVRLGEQILAVDD